MREFPLTPEELEEAARNLAKIRGVDPDKPAFHTADPKNPLWKLFAREIARLTEVSQAIDPIMRRWEEEEMERLTKYSDSIGSQERPN